MSRDPLDDLGRGDRGLIELLSHLTSEPSVGELAGEHAALTMFRSTAGGFGGSSPQASTAGGFGGSSPQASTAGGSEPAPLPTGARRRRRPSRARLGGRLVAAATVVVLGGGFAAAGYAEVLPAPLQHVAHQVFGFAGVPNSPGSSARPTLPVTSRTAQGGVGRGGSNSPPGSAGGTSHSPSSSPSPHRSASASPSPGSSATVTISAAQRRIAAGGSVRLTASFTRRGHAVAGVSLSLAELGAGRSTWRTVGQAATGSGGQVRFTVADLTTNASFRVTGPGHAVSGQLGIVVIPAMTVSEVPSAHGQSATLDVFVPLAQRGDVVQLEDLIDGQWQLVQPHRLHLGGQTTFSVAARKISVIYRVVLPATVEHGQSVSGQVTVAARPQKGGQGGR